MRPVVEDDAFSQWTEAAWPACTPTALWMVRPDGTGAAFGPDPSWSTAGVPAYAVPQLPFEKYHGHPELFATAVPSVSLKGGHPSLRFVEHLDYIRHHKPDVVTMQSPVTEHLPVPHFHHAQLRRANAVAQSLGRPPSFRIEAGPSPFGPFHMPPTTMRRLHMQPQPTWDRGCEWYKANMAELASVEKGYRMRYNRLPGGRDGFSYGIDALYPEYRWVPWINVEGGAVVRQPRLPDEFTEVRVLQLYTECVHKGVSDQETASSLGLYGIQAKVFASPTSHFWPLYSGACPELDHLQSQRVKKLSQFAVPRLLPNKTKPAGMPSRIHPKSVHVTAQKRRGVTDLAATRKKMVRIATNVWKAYTMKELRKELMEVRTSHLTSGPPGLIDADMKDIAGVERRERVLEYSRKGPPGDDSINACMSANLFADFDYGTVRALGEQMDILQSSGLPVDHILEDFEAHYEQFPIDFMEH